MREFELMRQGYERRTEALRGENIEQWRQVRQLAHVFALPYMKSYTDIFDFMELPGDPTKEERIALKKEIEQRDIAEARAAIKRFTDMGLNQAQA